MRLLRKRLAIERGSEIRRLLRPRRAVPPALKDSRLAITDEALKAKLGDLRFVSATISLTPGAVSACAKAPNPFEMDAAPGSGCSQFEMIYAIIAF